MGMADIAEVLWNDHLKHNPLNPKWADRDRFVLSNGHGSMLLYSLLHLTGYPLSIEDIKQFRQFGSHTAGHPELDLDLGIETTTGPLGQGITNAVGMALAESILASKCVFCVCYSVVPVMIIFSYQLPCDLSCRQEPKISILC